MDTLSILFSSRTKAEVLRRVFGTPTARLHLRELARQTGCSFSAVQREVKRLTDLELVIHEVDGNRTYVIANRDHPFYSDLANIVRKSCGWHGVLRDAILDDRVEFAFVFGSIATGNATAASDVDLFVIGNIGLRAVVKMLSGLTNKLGREINPHVCSKSEYVKRLRQNDHFIAAVMKTHKEFIIGTEDGLRGLEQ